MKENATLASQSGGGLLVVLEELKKLKRDHPKLEIHVVGHSAGAILLGGLINAISETDLKVTSATFWAPACTVEFYRTNMFPSISKGIVEDFAVFAMTDHAEQADNCAQIYHKSLLYLVSHAFEKYLRQPWVGKNPGKTMKLSGEPILGMEKWIESELKPDERKWDLVLSPNNEPDGTPNASRATSHGGFDDDSATLRATLARVLKRKSVADTFEKGPRSSASNRARRERLMVSGILS
jgi:hypothetical protein